MTYPEILKALHDGKRVYWCNIAYDVTKDQFSDHLQVTYSMATLHAFNQ